MKNLEMCLSTGKCVLLENLNEEVDASLEPILNKAFTKKGLSMYVTLNDKQVEVKKDFRLQMTTKLSRPHQLPDVCVTCLIINFMATEAGLTDQMSNLMLEMDQKDNYNAFRDAKSIEAGLKKDMTDIEDIILREMNNKEVELLDNTVLIAELDNAKVKKEELDKHEKKSRLIIKD